MFPSCTVFDVIYSRLEVAPKLKYGSIARCGKVCLDHKPLYTIERSPTLSNRDSSVCECSSLCFTSNLCNPFLKGVLLNGSFQSCHERFQPNRGFLSYRQSPSVRGLRKLPPVSEERTWPIIPRWWSGATQSICLNGQGTNSRLEVVIEARLE